MLRIIAFLQFLRVPMCTFTHSLNWPFCTRHTNWFRLSICELEKKSFTLCFWSRLFILKRKLFPRQRIIKIGIFLLYLFVLVKHIIFICFYSIRIINWFLISVSLVFTNDLCQDDVGYSRRGETRCCENPRFWKAFVEGQTSWIVLELCLLPMWCTIFWHKRTI